VKTQSDESNFFGDASEEFYLDAFFSWFFRQISSKGERRKEVVVDFINELILSSEKQLHVEEIEAIRVWRQEKVEKYRIDLWIELLVERGKKQELLVILIENKLHSNESMSGQLEIYEAAVGRYYDGPQSRDDLKNNFGLERLERKPEIVSVYIKLDYSFDEECAARKYQYIGVDKVADFFEKRFFDSEILSDFCNWLKEKKRTTDATLNELKSDRVNERLLSEPIYQYGLMKKLFKLDATAITEAHADANNYLHRGLTNGQFLIIGHNRGTKNWIQYWLTEKKEYGLFYRLEGLAQGYVISLKFYTQQKSADEKKTIDSIRLACDRYLNAHGIEFKSSYGRKSEHKEREKQLLTMNLSQIVDQASATALYHFHRDFLDELKQLKIL
jgi:hypothetical protein